MKNRLQYVLKNNKGFTLIELMVVIVVVLILASIAIPSFSKLVDEANYAAKVAEGRTVYMVACYDVEIWKMNGISGSTIYSCLQSRSSNNFTVNGTTYNYSTYMEQLKEETGVSYTPSFTVNSSTGVITEMKYRDLSFPSVIAAEPEEDDVVTE